MNNVCIIGAGMAGLSAAEALRAAGVEVRLFDKGRGAGGRLATRRAEPFQFDHGAQYFTVGDEVFGARVLAWEADGLVAPWPGRFVEMGDEGLKAVEPSRPRYVGSPTMNAPLKALSQDLGVTFGCRIDHLQPIDGGWRLIDEQGAMRAEASWVISAVPAPQVPDLMAPSKALVAAAQAAVLDPCWTLMAGFEAPLDLEVDGIQFKKGALGWAARSSSKPGREAHQESWVIQAAPAWSNTHLERDKDEIAPELLGLFFETMDLAPKEATYLSAHRWRYARVDEVPATDGFLIDPERRLAIAGDWMLDARVEAAWLSGHHLAEAVLPYLTRS